MSDDNTLGELKVDINGNTKPLEDSGAKVNTVLKNISGSVKQAVSDMTTELAVAAAAFTSLKGIIDGVMGTISSADALGKLSQSLGISVDQLSRLEYAAQTAGIGVDTLNNGMKHLADLVVQHGPFDQGTLIFTQLGISVKNAAGQFKSADEIVLELSDKISGMTDGVQKADLMNQIFGNRIGTQLTPLLNQGSAAIKQLGEEGAKTGGILGGVMVIQATALDDTLSRVKASSNSFFITLTSSVLPALQTLATNFDKSSSGGLALQIVAEGLGVLFKGVVTVVEGVVIQVVNLGVAIYGLGKAITEVAKGDWKTASDTINGTMKDMTDRMKGFSDDFAAMWTGLATDALWTATVVRDQVAPPILKSADDIKNALANMLSDNSIDPSVKIAKLNAALKAGQVTWAEYGQDVDTALKPLEDFAQGQTADAISQNLLSAADQMGVLNKAVSSGAIGFRAYDKMAQTVFANQKSNLEDLATQTASTITAIFGQNKGAAIASAIINTAVGISKALSAYPPPFNFAMAALVAASGAAQIATIKSTTQNGGGGTPSVNGSAASSATAATQAAPAAPQQTLNVTGINPNSMFSGDQVRGLAQTLINFQKDGGRVIID